jgi:membrane fusion protein (multidrug efflux system)
MAGCGGEPAQLPSEPPAVGVIEVGEQKVNPYIEFVGKTRAEASVALLARVTGFLEAREFEEGGDVEAGQVLFEIEPDQYQATLAQAEASLAAAEASLNRAQVDLARYQELRKSNNVSQQEVDKTQAEVLVQEAAVETAKADIEKARLNVAYTRITAPIAGRIDVAAFDVGNLIGPDSGVLATINRMDPINVTFSLAETWYLEIQQQAQQRRADTGDADAAAFLPRLRLADGTLYEHAGRFDFFDNKVDEATGTVQIRAEFPNPDRLLLPGQFVTVVIERRDAVDAVLLPQAAMLTDQGGSYVLLVNDQNLVETRRIRTGQRFGAGVVVEEGLAPGERVILYGIQKVRPGIEVVPELSEGPSDPAAQATSELPPAGDEIDATGAAAGEDGAEAQAEPAAAEDGDAEAAPADDETDAPAGNDTGAGEDAASGDDDAGAADVAAGAEADGDMPKSADAD